MTIVDFIILCYIIFGTLIILLITILIYIFLIKIIPLASKFKIIPSIFFFHFFSSSFFSETNTKLKHEKIQKIKPHTTSKHHDWVKISLSNHTSTHFAAQRKTSEVKMRCVGSRGRMGSRSKVWFKNYGGWVLGFKVGLAWRLLYVSFVALGMMVFVLLVLLLWPMFCVNFLYFC